MDSCVIDNVSHGITWYLTVVRGDMWGPFGDHLGVAGVLTQSNPRTKRGSTVGFATVAVQPEFCLPIMVG